MATYQPGSFMRISVPGNWRQIGGRQHVTYALTAVSSRRRTAIPHSPRHRVGDAGNGGSLGAEHGATAAKLREDQPWTQPAGRLFPHDDRRTPRLTTTLSNVRRLTGEREAGLSTVQLHRGRPLHDRRLAAGSAHVLPTFSRAQSLELERRTGRSGKGAGRSASTAAARKSAGAARSSPAAPRRTAGVRAHGG